MERERERVDSEGSGRGSGRNTPREYDEPRRPDTPGPMPQYRYSREQLLEMKLSPTSQIRPSCLSDDFFTAENIWDPEKWVRSFDGSRSNSPMLSGDIRERKRSIEFEREAVFRRGNGFTQDPRERLKEEKDGIVLSPQRRSFGTGCHVNMNRQISCPADFNNGPDRDRDRRDQRRIGSGRIQIERDRDKPRDFRNSHDRYERDDRNYGRYRRDHERDYRESSYNRIPNRRGHREKEEEPEWFTGGPTSQSEFIELRGFDKPESEQEDIVEEKETEKPGKAVQKDGEISVADRNGSLETNESSSPNESNHSGNNSPQQNQPPTTSLFDFNEFFKIENMSGIKEGVLADTEQLTGARSRFTSWFKMPGSQGNSHENSRRSSFNDDFAYLQDLVSGTKSPLIPSPPPPTANSVFHDSSPLFFLNNSQLDKSDALNQHKAPGSMLQNSTPFSNKPRNRGNFSTQDAEAQLKALLFGRKDSTASSSGTASPVVNSPLNVFGRVKTLAELEASLRNQPCQPTSLPPHSHRSPSPLQSKPPPMPNIHPTQYPAGLNFSTGSTSMQTPPNPMSMPPLSMHQPPPHHQMTPQLPPVGKEDDGDLTAFNKLLSLMKAGAASESPKMPMMRSDPRAPSPPMILNSKLAQNEFYQALQRNKEQQLHIQMQTLQSLQCLQDQSVSQLNKPPPQFQADPILNFIKQNPTIITKPASPTPPPQHPIMGVMQNTSTPRAPSPSLPIMQQNLLPQQPQPPQSPRIASPLMFSQQPPVHLSAPSPIHPGNLSRTSPVPTASGNSLNPPTSPRVPTPQELVAHTQAIMQNALIKRQLEEQKERFIRKQQERSKSPPVSQGLSRSPVMFVNQTPTPQGKPAVSAAFTPTSVIKKMHSEKAEKERQKSEGPAGDSGSPEIHSPVLNMNRSEGEECREQLDLRSQLSIDEINDKNKNIRAVIGQGFMQAGVPFPVSGVSLPPQTLTQPTLAQGRPIMKGLPNTTLNTSVQNRPPVSIQQPVKSDPAGLQRAIVGMNTGNNTFDINKLLQQQRQLSSSPNPLVRPAGTTPVTPTPFPGIPITGRIPVGSNPVVSPPGAVHAAAAANALLMMQGVSPSVRANAINQLNQLNQLSQLNQLAALQAQQRMLDPRLQGMPRGVYPGVPPPLLSPRGNVTAPTNLNLATPNPALVNAAINRALSPQTPGYKPNMNGPISPGFPGQSIGMNGNNNRNIHGSNNLMKWFGGDVLKTSLPSMPPVASPGQKVMTVDEIERCQQTVTN